MNPHKTNREIAEENSNIPYPKIMKYRLKNFKQYGTFEKCEALSSNPSEMDVYSPNGKMHVYPQFTEHQLGNTDLFEPIEERIELERCNVVDPPSRWQVQTKTGEDITDEDIKLWEEASNGEMIHKKSIKSSMKYAVERAKGILGKGCVDDNWVNDWLKDKQSK